MISNANSNLILFNNSVNLRAIQENDIFFIRKWLDKPYILKWFHNSDAWIEEIEHRFDRFSFIKHFIAEFNNIPFGFCQYYDYKQGHETWHNNIDIDNTFSIDYMIGEERFLSQGLAKEMIFKLEQLILVNGDNLKIIVQPESDNTISRNLLSSCNYDYDYINDIFFKYI